MINNTEEWLNTALVLSGETEITKDVIIGTIELVECSLIECGDPEDVITLDELSDMLCSFN